MRATRPGCLAATALLAATAACGWGTEGASDPEQRPVPVEVASVEHGEIALRRTLHASLEASTRIVVASVAGGRVASLPVDLGDTVQRGQVVALLDRGEAAQAVGQARATLALGRAQLAEAVAQLELAERDLERVRELHTKGAVSDADLDAVVAREAEARAAAEAARAEIEHAQASVATRIVADWSGTDATRVVAERLVDEGTIVSPNTELLTLVDLDPLTGVTFVTERDHARLQPGQPVTVWTDAWPGEPFPGEVGRVAPVFDAASRQARVELALPNPDGRLKPGMFVRAEVVLDTASDATIVPADALVQREGQRGVFVVDGTTASLRPVEVGLRDGDRVQVTGDVDGQVVVLGQQLLHDGATVTIADEPP